MANASATYGRIDRLDTSEMRTAVLDAPEQGEARATGDVAFPAIDLLVVPDSWYVRRAKPVIDVLGAMAILTVLLPVLAVLMLAVAVSMGRPALFRQERVGRNERRFTVLKFRTMVSDRRRAAGRRVDGPDRRRAHKTANDPRVTRVGGFLRKWSLDELPQLWNVVRGEMSLVGPRPELTTIVAGYEPWQHLRHVVKPGITGLWQVSQRGDGLMHEHVELDLAYVTSVSARTDLKILLRTLYVLVRRPSGY